MADENRLNSILCKFDADWMASDEARTEATNDLYFSRVSQWDDWLSNYTTLQYRGQFDVVRPVVRKLVAEMRRNPIDVLFRPKDGANPDAADVLMGMYRTDMRHNTAKIAVNVGVREQIESGVGAWRLVTQYEDNDPTSNNQVIRRLPIHEACSHVIWDANSKQMDKSDAKHCTVINALTASSQRRVISTLCLVSAVLLCGIQHVLYDQRQLVLVCLTRLRDNQRELRLPFLSGDKHDTHDLSSWRHEEMERRWIRL